MTGIQATESVRWNKNTMIGQWRDGNQRQPGRLKIMALSLSCCLQKGSLCLNYLEKKWMFRLCLFKKNAIIFGLPDHLWLLSLNCPIGSCFTWRILLPVFLSYSWSCFFDLSIHSAFETPSYSSCPVFPHFHSWFTYSSWCELQVNGCQSVFQSGNKRILAFPLFSVMPKITLRLLNAD